MGALSAQPVVADADVAAVGTKCFEKVGSDLRTIATDFASLVSDYENLWNQFN